MILRGMREEPGDSLLEYLRAVSIGLVDMGGLQRPSLTRPVT